MIINTIDGVTLTQAVRQCRLAFYLPHARSFLTKLLFIFRHEENSIVVNSPKCQMQNRFEALLVRRVTVVKNFIVGKRFRIPGLGSYTQFKP